MFHNSRLKETLTAKLGGQKKIASIINFFNFLVLFDPILSFPNIFIKAIGSMYGRVERFSTFSNFENGHIANGLLIRNRFRSSNKKNPARSIARVRHRWNKLFIFYKITGTLNFFILQNTFLVLQEQSLKKNLK